MDYPLQALRDPQNVGSTLMLCLSKCCMLNLASRSSEDLPAFVAVLTGVRNRPCMTCLRILTM